MKYLIGIWLMNLIFQTVAAHTTQVRTDSIALYFSEAKKATQQHAGL